MRKNIMLMTDSYKVSQAVQYPPKTEKIYSYWAGRGTADDWDYGNEMVFFGLQYFMKEYLEGPVVTMAGIKEARILWAQHFGREDVFQEDKWKHILINHDGRLPIKIKALYEGTVIPSGVVPFTIENTDPECYWLTNWLETLLSQVWYPTAVASRSRYMKKDILAALEKTGDPSLIGFKLHDFGYRGVSCEEQAALGGAAHLLNFMGTDTFAGCRMLMQYYGAEMPGFSIPATEHSTITSWGKVNEAKAIRNHLENNPTGLVACVLDSYNIYMAVGEIVGGELKDLIMERDGVFVNRPDSGHPPDVIEDVLSILGDKFGYTLNDKGFKVLDPHVRVLQGDGIDPSMLKDILTRLEKTGWSADNVAFGSGGGLLVKGLNRDTFKAAIKCSYTEQDGKGFDVFKDPITDPGKRSKRGRLATIFKDTKWKTVREEDATEANPDLLQEVFVDGKLTRECTLEGMRQLTAV